MNSNTKMVLVNILHFKSEWLDTFDETLVNKEFEVNGDSLVKVPMMIGDFDSVEYRKSSKGTQIFGLPFKDENYQMVLVLPPENTSKIFCFIYLTSRNRSRSSLFFFWLDIHCQLPIGYTAHIFAG